MALTQVCHIVMRINGNKYISDLVSKFLYNSSSYQRNGTFQWSRDKKFQRISNTELTRSITQEIQQLKKFSTLGLPLVNCTHRRLFANYENSPMTRHPFTYGTHIPLIISS